MYMYISECVYTQVYFYNIEISKRSTEVMYIKVHM